MFQPAPPMRLLLAAVSVLVAGGLAAAGTPERWRTRLVGPAVTIAGCAIGFAAAASALMSGATSVMTASWSMPGAAFHCAVDPLSAFFLTALFVVAGCAAAASIPYLRDHRGGAGRRYWPCYAVLTAAMAVVLIARDAYLFLVAWETMALASYLLVTLDERRDDVRAAGRLYLIATHVGAAFLVAMFALLGARSGSLDFDGFSLAGAGGAAHGIFALAIVGFGTKAGWVPFHVWLPEAHPAAPSPVSSLMSGVMVSLGVYGVLRVLLMAGGSPDPRWGWALLAIGVASAVMGALHAQAHSDLKRVLAFSTVENTGVMALGLGLGTLAFARDATVVGRLAYAAAIIHVLNHALFKGLLFLDAGGVLRAAGTTDLRRLGGLSRAMPRAAAAFLVGSASAAALPPTVGFVGEFLLALAAIVALSAAPTAAAGVVVLVTLGLASGLALSAFARAFGIAFLGEPREDLGAGMRDLGRTTSAAVGLLGLACLTLGAVELALVPEWVDRLRGAIPGADPLPVPIETAFAASIVLAAGAAIWALRRALGPRVPATVPTWSCGATTTSPRMQYTAESFSQPLLSLAGRPIGRKRRLVPPVGLFPSSASLEIATDDPVLAAYARAFRGNARAASGLRRLQQGRVQVYVLYIALTLFAVMAWVVARLP